MVLLLISSFAFLVTSIVKDFYHYKQNLTFKAAYKDHYKRLWHRWGVVQHSTIYILVAYLFAGLTWHAVSFVLFFFAMRWWVFDQGFNILDHRKPILLHRGKNYIESIFGQYSYLTVKLVCLMLATFLIFEPDNLLITLKAVWHFITSDYGITVGIILVFGGLAYFFYNRPKFNLDKE